jgi:hypothetical protein
MGAKVWTLPRPSPSLLPPPPLRLLRFAGDHLMKAGLLSFRDDFSER